MYSSKSDSDSTIDTLRETLKTFREALPQISYLLLTNRHGEKIVDLMPNVEDEEAFQQGFCNFLAVTQRFLDTFDLEEDFRLTYLKFANYYVTGMRVGTKGYLITTCTKDVKPGLLSLDTKRTVAKLLEILESTE